MKKIKVLQIVLLIYLVLTGCGREKDPSLNENKEEKKDLKVTENQVLDDWKRAYIERISKDEELGEKEELTYQLVDLDGAYPPELYINGCCEGAGSKILTYYNGSISEQRLLRLGGLIYQPGSGIFVNENGNMDYYYDEVFKLEQGKFNNIHTGRFESESDDEGKTGPVVNEEGEIVYRYYWDEKELSEEEYHEMLKSYIDGAKEAYQEEEQTYDEMIDKIRQYDQDAAIHKEAVDEILS